MKTCNSGYQFSINTDLEEKVYACLLYIFTAMNPWSPRWVSGGKGSRWRPMMVWRSIQFMAAQALEPGHWESGDGGARVRGIAGGTWHHYSIFGPGGLAFQQAGQGLCAGESSLAQVSRSLLSTAWLPSMKKMTCIPPPVLSS